MKLITIILIIEYTITLYRFDGFDTVHIEGLLPFELGF